MDKEKKGNSEIPEIEINVEDENIISNIDDSFAEKLAEKQEEEKIINLEKEVDELKDKIIRSQAEFLNYKRRLENEKSELTTFANEKIICELLTSLDNLDRALESTEDHESPLYKGVALTRDQLKTSLAKFGVSEVDNSIIFDPNFHHAVMQEEGDTPGVIVAVFQKGYMLKDKVIRASMVKVSK